MKDYNVDITLPLVRVYRSARYQYTALFGSGGTIVNYLSASSSGKFDYDPNLETCSIVKDSYGRTSKTFLFVMGFLIPCVVIVGCYAKIFWVVHK